VIELDAKQVVVDGTPRIVMAGEVHYFRVAHEECAGEAVRVTPVDADAELVVHLGRP